MKPARIFLTAVCLLVFCKSACASVTLVFNAPFSGGMSSNLADRDGVVSNGMAYGIIVDTSGNGFLSSYQLNFSTAPNSITNLLTSGGQSSDDFVIIAGDKTSDSSQGGLVTEGDFVTLGGNGGVSGIAGLNLTGTIGAGDKFMLVWFDNLPGVNMGSFIDASFVLPADGSTTNFDGAFVGVDPVRPTSAIPESSTAFLGLLGAVGLMKRRR